MAELVFRLNQVSEDEAEEVRELLNAHDIRFYETSAGAFGLSLAGIWLPDDSQLSEARSLLDDYGRKRAQTQQQEYAERQARGEVETFWLRLRRQPVRILLYLLALTAVAYISVVPFVKGF